MKTKIISFAIFAAALFGFGSCKNNYAAKEKPVITVSIEPQRWLLEHIVGDKMEVRTLMARGGNPESYEPSFSHLADLESSVLYMKMGNLGFEYALIERISSSLPELQIVNTSDSIALITDDHGHDHGIDPHVWSSTVNARIIARNMLRAVSELDPGNADEYSQNYNSLIAKIDSVDSLCSQILKEQKGESFMVWHPSLSYFARDYGLHQISVGIEGKEHSVLNTKEILRQANDENAGVFLVQQDFDKAKIGGLLNNESPLRVETINPLNYEWDTEILRTAGAIAGH